LTTILFDVKTFFTGENDCGTVPVSIPDPTEWEPFVAKSVTQEVPSKNKKKRKAKQDPYARYVPTMGEFREGFPTPRVVIELSVEPSNKCLRIMDNTGSSVTGVEAVLTDPQSGAIMMVCSGSWDDVPSLFDQWKSAFMDAIHLIQPPELLLTLEQSERAQFTVHGDLRTGNQI
jgi:hypothetical protein